MEDGSMSGLILLVVLSLWVTVVTALTGFFTQAMRVGLFRFVAQLLLFVVIFIAPVADEIIGGFQFRALCEVETVMRYDKEKLSNKKVMSQLLNEVHVDNIFTPVISQTWNYINIENQEILLSYKTLDSKGGWLSRLLGFQSLSSPFTFDGHCGPSWARVDEVFHRLHVTVTNK